MVPSTGGGRFRGRGGPSLPEEYNAEFSLLLGKGLTALEVRDFLSGEFTPISMAEVMAVLKARETREASSWWRGDGESSTRRGGGVSLERLAAAPFGYAQDMLRLASTRRQTHEH